MRVFDERGVASRRRPRSDCALSPAPHALVRPPSRHIVAHAGAADAAVRLSAGVAPTQAAAHAPTAVVPPPATSRKQMSFRSLEGNSYLLSFPSGGRVLVDPWLTGQLTFGPPALDFLYTADKPGKTKAATGPHKDRDNAETLEELARTTDVIVLSQGLPDHAHEPTLRALPKGIPVVASPSAARVATRLGFTRVSSIAPGSTVVAGGVTFAATEGALVVRFVARYGLRTARGSCSARFFPVFTRLLQQIDAILLRQGPPWSQRENGFVMSDGLASVYAEAHADFLPASVAAAAGPGGVDVVVSPVIGVALAGYPLVLGSVPSSLALLHLLRPSVLVALRNDDVVQRGLIAPLISTAGGVAAVRDAVAADPQLAGIDVLEPPPGVDVRLALRRAAGDESGDEGAAERA